MRLLSVKNYLEASVIVEALKKAGVENTRLVKSWPQKRKGYRDVLIEGLVKYAKPVTGKERQPQAKIQMDSLLQPFRDREAVNLEHRHTHSILENDQFFEFSVTFMAALPSKD